MIHSGLLNSFNYSVYNMYHFPIISLENGLIKLYCVWSNIITRNNTHIMFSVCAADDFRKYWKMRKMSFFNS